MKHDTLNLDSRYNVFCGSLLHRWFSHQLAYEVPSTAGPLLHIYFDNNQWLLLPEESVLERYRGSFHSFSQGQFVEPLREQFPRIPVCPPIMTSLSF